MSNEIRSWSELEDDYRDAEMFPCKPTNITKLREGTIIDEEQSVR